jgi:PIN domain nuclease of toxin-antitoxin system
MRDLLLDTHVWIWLSIEENRAVSKKAAAAFKNSRPWISAISCWELAKLVERGRIRLAIPTISWVRRSLNENDIRVADLTPEIAVESTQLKDFHSDPADQIIVATSRILGMPLLTSDRRILDFKDVETIW